MLLVVWVGVTVLFAAWLLWSVLADKAALAWEARELVRLEVLFAAPPAVDCPVAERDGPEREGL